MAKITNEYPSTLQQKLEVMLLDGSLPFNAILVLNNLSEQLGASRTDTALVLRSAHRKGLVDLLPDGTYKVRAPAKASIESVFQHTARLGFKPTTVVRNIQVIKANAEVARRLKVDCGEPVYLQVRSRLVQDQMLANQHNYIPIEVCPHLESKDLSHRSFQETLEQDYHAVVSEVEENCQLLPANQEDRQILGLGEHDEVLVVQRLSLSATQQPLVWADIHIRIDRIDYVAALWPNAAKLIKDRN